MLFWNRFDDAQAKEYRLLTNKINPWLAWCATKSEERGPEPPMPTDQEFIRHELLAMIGWGVEHA